MFPLIASVVGGALQTPQLQVGGLPKPQPMDPIFVVGVLIGLGLVGGLVYLAVRE